MASDSAAAGAGAGAGDGAGSPSAGRSGSSGGSSLRSHSGSGPGGSKHMNAAERFLYERSLAGGHAPIPLDAAWAVIEGAWRADADLRRADKELFASVNKLVVELCSQREHHLSDELYRRWRGALDALVAAEKARRAAEGADGGKAEAAAKAFHVKTTNMRTTCNYLSRFYSYHAAQPSLAHLIQDAWLEAGFPAEAFVGETPKPHPAEEEDRRNEQLRQERQREMDSERERRRAAGESEARTRGPRGPRDGRELDEHGFEGEDDEHAAGEAAAGGGGGAEAAAGGGGGGAAEAAAGGSSK